MVTMAAASVGVNEPSAIAPITLARASGRSAALAIFGNSGSDVGRSRAGGMILSITSLHAQDWPFCASATTCLMILAASSVNSFSASKVARVRAPLGLPLGLPLGPEAKRPA